MTARELYQAGRLNEAVAALSAELRELPADRQRRAFLFELLCFAGDYTRAEKQLDILARGGNEARLGALIYKSALHAERTRQELFQKKEYPAAVAAGQIPGTWNGTPFQSLEDADPRIGARLELFAAGQYIWIPFEHIASIEIEPPKRLRDLLWAPALVRAGPAFRDRELGEVLLPVLTPLASMHPDDAVRLGRVTAWQEIDGEEIPEGQKMFIIDGEEYPILELRKLEFHAAFETHASAQ